MKTIYFKRKSFTLIELLVAVAIFSTVSLATVAIVSSTVSSKSKIQATNQLRTEGSQIMAMVQDMVESGNTYYGTAPNRWPGVAVTDSDGVVPPGGACWQSSYGLLSSSTDSQGKKTLRVLRVKNNKIWLDQTVNGTANPGLQISSNQITVDRFNVMGDFRNEGGCTNKTTQVTVYLTLRIAATGGADSSLYLASTFTSKYPAPDLASDFNQ